jgi:hypothetical protein
MLKSVPESKFVLQDVFYSLVLSILFAAFVVNFSAAAGKLALPPWYDDSHSMVEGALRWMTFQREGFAAAWSEYLARPPHSFLHYYWTSLLYGVFGISDGVVYRGMPFFYFARFLFLP